MMRDSAVASASRRAGGLRTAVLSHIRAGGATALSVDGVVRPRRWPVGRRRAAQAP
jgi:hypothetical protein